MSLRAKLLGLFGIFGVLPVVALGVGGYLRSIESVEDLIRERTGAIATHLAGEIEARYALRRSDLALFAGNAETLGLFGAHASGDAAAYRQARSSAESFLGQAWDLLGASYGSVLFREPAGSVIHRLGHGPGSGPSGEGSLGDEREVVTVVEPVRDVDTGREYGTVEAVVRLRTLIPVEALSVSFGAEGYSVILDRANGRVLHHPSRTYLRQSVTHLLGPAGWNMPAAHLDEAGGSFGFTYDDRRHVASFVSMVDPPWTVVATGSVDEFAVPFARTRAFDLAVVILIAATVWVGDGPTLPGRGFAGHREVHRPELHDPQPRHRRPRFGLLSHAGAARRARGPVRPHGHDDRLLEPPIHPCAAAAGEGPT